MRGVGLPPGKKVRTLLIQTCVRRAKPVRVHPAATVPCGHHVSNDPNGRPSAFPPGVHSKGVKCKLVS